MQSLLVSRFDEAARKYGSRTAVVDYPDGHTARRSTFGELMRLSHQVAAFIQSKDIAPQSFITIELPASVEFLAAQMGIWIARCVTVAVGTNFPEERKSYIREHCEASMNIDTALINSIKDSELDFLDFELPDESDNAILVYTSGSTGMPKGILHDHKSLSRGVRMLNDHYQLTPEDRFAAGIPPYFIAELFYWELLCGTEVHIISPDVTKDVVKMAEYHRDNSITATFINATVYPIYRCLAPTMRLVITGSDRVISRHKPAYSLHNAYGLSETAGLVLGTVVSDPTDNAPIGRPVPGVECAILDDDLRPVPQGEEGEICLKGCFCKGYYKDEEKTQELYRGGWLHTGDLGRMLPDGRILYVNRKDWMVKVNGQRVEPGEVEATMVKYCEGIDRAVVKGFASENGSQYLVGYYTPANIQEENVRKVLQQKLPSYMVPSFLVPMDTFPLNANGKIDRKSLKAPERSALASNYVAPTNEVEAALCDIMGKVMGLQQVGIDDNFRQLGGDSIRMMSMQQLCADSELEILHNISTTIIYQGATPRKIAEMLDEAKPKVKPQMEDYPLNANQKYGYFYNCMERDGQVVGNVFELYQLDDNINMKSLSDAIRTAFAVHKSLFTRILLNADGEPRQKVAVEPLEIPVERMSEEEFETEKKNLVQPFHLLKDRLFRVRIFEVTHHQAPSTSHYLFLDIHHIIYDGGSMQILFRDIDRAYRGVALEPEDWSLAEMAVAEEEMRQGEFYNQALQWIRDSFSPEHYIKGKSTALAQSSRISCPLGIGSDELDKYCQHTRVSSNTITTAAYLLMLGRYAGTHDATVASFFNAREDTRVSNSVGFFARPILIRGRWNDNMLCSDYIHNVGKMLMDSISYSFVGLGAMVQELKDFPQFVFIYQGETLSDLSIGGHPINEVELPQKVNPVGLDVHLRTNQSKNTMTMELQCNDQWLGAEAKQRMAECYTECLRSLMTARTIGEVLCPVPEEDKF